MKIKSESGKLYAIVGSPVLHPSDEEATAWAEAMVDILEDKVEEYYEQSSAFSLKVVGLGCMVTQTFSVEAKAEEVAQMLNTISGDIEFFVLELDSDDEGINEKKIRECGVAISVDGSLPWASSTHLFLTDTEYARLVNNHMVDWDGEIYTLYAADEDEAEAAVWEFIMEDDND